MKSLINWHHAQCACEGEGRCIHCQTAAALKVGVDLLAALEEMLADYVGAYGGEPQDEPACMKQARAAIAKATGETR